MSDIPSLPVLQQFVDQFLDPSNPGQVGKGNRTLFSGVVKSYNTTTKKVLVTIDGADVPLAPYINPGAWTVGTVVWGVRDGNNRILLGELGKSIPSYDQSYMTAYNGSGQTVSSAAWTRMSFSATEGNTALWSGANNQYTIPTTGVYSGMLRARIADTQTASLSVALGLGIGNAAPDESVTHWDAIPASGSFRRLTLIMPFEQVFTAGQLLCAAMYMDGASTIVTSRVFSIMKIRPYP